MVHFGRLIGPLPDGHFFAGDDVGISSLITRFEFDYNLVRGGDR